jgi:hypothetical protein
MVADSAANPGHIKSSSVLVGTVENETPHRCEGVSMAVENHWQTLLGASQRGNGG